MAYPKKHIGISMIFLSLLLGIIEGKAQIVSDFTSNDESWKVYNEPSGGAPYLPIVWSSTGGNPGGYISETDISIGAWGWLAPSEFKGDLSAYYNFYLSFDLREDSHVGLMDSYYDVMICNASGDTMVFNTTYDPLPINTWVNYIIPLTTAAGWKYGSSIAGGAPAVTAAQMTAILGDVSKMRIRAEFSGLTYETNGMDNVMFTCDLLLPVQLTSFSAEAINNKLSRLFWTTESESNCHGFIIEKSVDFVTFDSIGFIEGNGTTSTPHDYEFYDNNFMTSAYYRLREVNYEGRMFSSDIVYLKNAYSNILTTFVYPNPTDDIITIVADDVNRLFRYTVSDLSGRNMMEVPVGDYNGYFTASISMAQYPSGVYIITMEKKDGVDIQKINLIK
ncbi:MAG TPA: T9SS type A sorting domain-containing protein [Saprospiraceae bacterium]|nr:T9SS type A sorting domain-containing protein [Saprospiraceae bacterium]